MKHSAGVHLKVKPNDLFRRDTDQVVKRKIGHQPLDVGADRIARTAHAALALLEELREMAGLAIPLAWHNAVEGVSAIEVYPAATLTAYGVQATGYKKKGEVERRARMLNALRKHMVFPDDTSLMESNADVLDAGVCVLAAADFLNDRVVHPKDMAKAEKEGWIWFCAGDGF